MTELIEEISDLSREFAQKFPEKENRFYINTSWKKGESAKFIVEYYGDVSEDYNSINDNFKITCNTYDEALKVLKDKLILLNG
jgi:hypothetical protein